MSIKKIYQGDWSQKQKIDMKMFGSLKSLIFIDGEHRKNFYSLFFNITRQEIRELFEKHFTKGMNWSNYGKWHIDHLTPRSWFYYKHINDGEVWNCWHPDNLRPKWRKENFTKSNNFSDQDRETFIRTQDTFVYH